jgi:hypothetical protein
VDDLEKIGPYYNIIKNLSTKKLIDKFKEYIQNGDFIGADVTFKFTMKKDPTIIIDDIRYKSWIAEQKNIGKGRLPYNCKNMNLNLTL